MTSVLVAFAPGPPLVADHHCAAEVGVTFLSKTVIQPYCRSSQIQEGGALGGRVFAGGPLQLRTPALRAALRRLRRTARSAASAVRG